MNCPLLKEANTDFESGRFRSPYIEKKKNLKYIKKYTHTVPTINRARAREKFLRLATPGKALGRMEGRVIARTRN
jgi:hypothetical protein